MRVINVELFTDQKNGAVLRLPDRQFPGVLIQGDTLQSYITDLSEIADECKQLDGGESVCEQLEDFVERFIDLKERYDNAVQTQGES